MSRSASRNKKVKVWGRIRPTAQFANNNLELLTDTKVSKCLFFGNRRNRHPFQNVHALTTPMQSLTFKRLLHNRGNRVSEIENLIYLQNVTHYSNPVNFDRSISRIRNCKVKTRILY